MDLRDSNGNQAELPHSWEQWGLPPGCTDRDIDENAPDSRARTPAPVVTPVFIMDEDIKW